MKPKQWYLLLAVLGFGLPYWRFVPWVLAHGLDMRLFLTELWVNAISRFFGWDVIASAITLVVFMRVERSRVPIERAWMPVVGLLLVGVSFGLPMFLYLREDARQRAGVPVTM